MFFNPAAPPVMICAQSCGVASVEGFMLLLAKYVSNAFSIMFRKKISALMLMSDEVLMLMSNNSGPCTELVARA